MAKGDGAKAEAAGDSQSSEKVFTLAEIAAHNSSTSIWMCINGGVYDITPYLNDHPGGSEIMLLHAGKVATQACV